MSKNLVIYEKNPLNFLIFYKRFKNIFIENNFNNITKENKNHIKVKQFYDGIHIKESDYKVSRNVNKVFEKLTNFKREDLKDGDLKKANNTFKQKIALYVCDIQRCFTFASTIKKKYQIKEKIYIETSIFNYKVYKTMKELKLIDKDIDIVSEVKVISKIFYLLKNTYFFFKIILFPEISLFKNKIFKKMNSSKTKKVISIFIKDIRFDKNALNLTFLETGELTDEIIYVTEEKNIEKSKNYSKYSNKIINFNKDLFKHFNFFYFLKHFYLGLFFKRIYFLKLALKNPIFLNVLFGSLRSIVNWKLFYALYETKFHLNAMSDEKIFIKKIHNQNNVKTIFLYFSSTEELIKKNFRDNFTRVNYVYLNYDFFVSDEISIKLFKLQKTKVGKYIKIGNIGADIINANEDEHLLKINKLKINISNNKKILSFFDHSIGRDGVWNQLDYNLFFKKILLVIRKYKYEIIYKSKKNKNELFKNFSEENRKLFYEILKFNNFTYLDGKNKKLSAYQIIAMSDLIISAPVSSIISETLSASKKILVYDPNGKYKSKHFFINKISEFYCKDENNFISKLEKIITMKNNIFSKKILDIFIFKILKTKNYGSNIENLLKVIK